MFRSLLLIGVLSPAIAAADGSSRAASGTLKSIDAVQTRCDMVDAALRIRDKTYQAFYKGASCGKAAVGKRKSQLIVDVVTPQGPMFAKDESCRSRLFSVYKPRDLKVSNKLLRLTFESLDTPASWAFGAEYFDPDDTNEDTNASEWESTEYLCHLIDGKVAYVNGHWTASRGSAKIEEAAHDHAAPPR